MQWQAWLPKNTQRDDDVTYCGDANVVDDDNSDAVVVVIVVVADYDDENHVIPPVTDINNGYDVDCSLQWQ